MAANYAKIDMVGSLDEGFQQVSLVKHFPKFSQNCYRTSIV